MITVKKLKEILDRYDESMEIILVTNELPWKPLNEVTLDQLSTIKESRQVIALK